MSWDMEGKSVRYKINSLEEMQNKDLSALKSQEYYTGNNNFVR